MSDTTLQTALELEHRQIDGGIETFTSQPTDTAPLFKATEALRRHIYLEEAFLFPPLREAGLMMPILVMIREHGEIWQAMDRVEELLNADAENDVVMEACRELARLQDKHNEKEEPIIYSQADQKLGFEDATQLVAYLESSTLPEGWVYSALE
ncbi:MAG: hemerythrin domain-containing protein [Abditibacteriaceae bacterium]